VVVWLVHSHEASSLLSALCPTKAEKELKRRKKTYEDSLEEVKNKLDEIELKKSCDLVEWLILWFQEERARSLTTTAPLLLSLLVEQVGISSTKEITFMQCQDLYGEAYSAMQTLENYLVPSRVALR